jgi:hypothetical protein
MPPSTASGIEEGDVVSAGNRNVLPLSDARSHPTCNHDFIVNIISRHGRQE